MMGAYDDILPGTSRVDDGVSRPSKPQDSGTSVAPPQYGNPVVLKPVQHDANSLSPQAGDAVPKQNPDALVGSPGLEQHNHLEDNSRTRLLQVGSCASAKHAGEARCELQTSELQTSDRTARNWLGDALIYILDGDMAQARAAALRAVMALDREVAQ